MDMRFKLRSVNVPVSLIHKTRKEEIEDLPNYLEVTTTATNNLVMVFKGQTEPPVGQRDCLWIKTNASGAPIGSYIYNNGAWVTIPVGP